MDLEPSLSAPDVRDLDRNEFIGSILCSCRQNPMVGPFLGQMGRFPNKPSAFTLSFNILKSRFTHLTRRIRSLEALNKDLKADNLAAHAEIALLGHELQTSRINMYAEIEQRRKDAIHMQQADDRINDLVIKVKRYGDFIQTLTGIGLSNPLYHAALSVMSDGDAEEALVTSILEASKNKQSPWSRIIPAVVGPRSPEQYVSAINLTLRTRQELREREKLCEFWKYIAKLDPNNADLLTPSSSSLCDISIDYKADVDPQPRETVLEDMFERLKNERFPVPHPSFDSMAEWAESAAKEECYETTFPVLADTDDEQEKGFNEVRNLRPQVPPSIETVSILKNVDSPYRTATMTLPTPQRVRFILQEVDQPFSQSDLMPSSLSSNLFGIADNFRDGVTVQKAGQYLDDVIKTSLSNNPALPGAPVVQGSMDKAKHTLSTSLPIPSQDNEDELRPSESTGHVSPVVEEYFIVEADGDVPQLSVQLLKEPLGSRLTTSLSDHGLPSSGSEYSQMSAEMTEEEAAIAFMLSQRRAARKPVHPYLRPPVPRVTMGTQYAMQASDSKSDSETDSGHSFESKLPGIIAHLGDDSTPTKSRVRHHPGTHSAWSKPPISPAFSLQRTPSSPRKESVFSAVATRKVVTPLIAMSASMLRSVPSTSARHDDGQMSTRSPPMRAATNPAVPRRIGSRVTSPEIPKRSSPPVQVRVECKPLQKKPGSSKLAIPMSNIGDRPALQRIDLNLPTNQCISMTGGIELSDPFRSKTSKITNRNQGKRRGVIMMENMNIGSTTIPKPTTVETTVIVPVTSHIQLDEPPVFSLSVSMESAKIENPSLICDESSAHHSESEGGFRGRSTHQHSSSPDLSRFDPHISELVASMADSDLGSLEMTEDSDSEYTDTEAEKNACTVHMERSLNTLPQLCKDIMGGSSEIFGRKRVNSGNQQQEFSEDSRTTSKASESRIPTRRQSSSQISAAFGSSCGGEGAMPTSLSNSTSLSGSSSSFSLESPTRSKPASRVPLYSHSSRSERSTRSPTPEKVKLTATKTVSTTAKLKMPSPLGIKQVEASIPSPRPYKTVQKMLSPPSKVAVESSKLGSANGNIARASKQSTSDVGSAKDSRTPESKSWIAQNIFNRFSNSDSKTKTPPPVIPANKPAKLYLSPNGNTASPMKPRSNTINTLLPTFGCPSNRGTPVLDPPSSSTKPRSNTVNTYSPINRSPLSQHVTTNPAEFQLRSTQMDRPQPKTSQSTIPSPKSPVAKSIQPSRIAQTSPRSTAPLRVTKKITPATTTQPSSRDNGPAPPTAAFMIPKVSMTKTRRRASSSVAPLIPTCTSPNGVISPSQCRSLLRNSLSLVVR